MRPTRIIKQQKVGKAMHVTCDNGITYGSYKDCCIAAGITFSCLEVRKRRLGWWHRDLLSKEKLVFTKIKDSQPKEKPEEPTLHECYSLVSALILDSKENIITYAPRPRKSLENKERDWLDSSIRFLSNRDGLLEMYLNLLPNVEVKACLRECRAFVMGGWKSETRKNKVRGKA